MNPLLQSVQLAIQDGTQVEAIAYIDKLVDFCIANENGRVLPGWPRELIQLLVAYHIAKDTFVAEEDKDGKIEGLGMWYHCDKDEDDSLITEWKPDSNDSNAIFIGFLNAVNKKQAIGYYLKPELFKVYEWALKHNQNCFEHNSVKTISKERAAAKKREANKTQAPLPNPMRTTYNPTPYYDSPGEGSYFQYQRPPRPDGSQVEYPYTYASGGLMGLRRMQEGGEISSSEEMNEKELIEEAVAAIKGESDNPKEILGMFLLKFGEEQLRSLVGRVQSGELDDTVARFEEGDKGMVLGPGDGSGVDDMVPATLEGEQDVLLSDGEFVLRKKTTDALEKAYGGGFLDVINRAEKDAPEKLQRMVG